MQTALRSYTIVYERMQPAHDRITIIMQAAYDRITIVCSLHYDRKIRLVWPSHYTTFVRMVLWPLNYKPNAQQVVKVIWHKATSPPHMDSSIIFTRVCQCVHPSRHPHHTAAAPCLSILTTGHAQVCPAPSLSKLPLHARGSGPNHLIHDFLRPPESTS